MTKGFPFRDIDGNSLSVGDNVFTPADGSDPLIGRIAYMWGDWLETTMGVWDGEGIVPNTARTVGKGLLLWHSLHDSFDIGTVVTLDQTRKVL